MAMHGLVRPVTIFLVAGLVGPLIYRVPWPRPIIPFIGYLALLLWPTAPFGILEYGLGAVLAILITIGGNIVLFGMLGWAVGAASSRPVVLWGICLLVVVVICLFAFWTAGYSHLNALAVLTASAFYALLFWFATRRV